MNYEIEYNGNRALCTTMGAELISFRNAGENREYIWTGDPEYWSGHNPILFPVLCSLKNSKTVFDKTEYEIPKHGFARHSEFSLLEKSENSVTFILENNEATEKMYPFAFAFTVTHTVNDKGFSTAFRVINKGTSEMMFQLGGHTGFCLPFSDKYSFSDHSLVFDLSEYAVNYKAPTGGLIVNPEGASDVLNGTDRISLSYDKFKNDAIMLTKLGSEWVKLTDPDGKGVRMRISDFAALGIWTPSAVDSPFICIEPWNGLPAFENENGMFKDKPFIIKLNAGKEYTAGYEVEMLNG